MAYIIDRIAGRRRPATVVNALVQALARTRFVCTIRLDGPGVVRLDPVRLFEKKDYCGNHPGPCPVRFGGERPHRHFAYLEGADWVALNDLVNDVLDRLEVEARVASTTCVIRRNRRRRVHYGQVSFVQSGNPGRTFVDWARTGADSDYEDWCGRRGAPRSAYVAGTPGYYGISRTGQRRHAGLSDAPRRRGPRPRQSSRRPRPD
jgi:hypothetical protein